MNRKNFFLASLLLLLVLASLGGATLAQSPTVNWQAQYYNNPSLLGEPFKTVAETAIDHDWGDKAPFDGLPADNFSARWTATVPFEAGTYTFSATVDDGLRLWIDGEMVMDEWRPQSPTTFTVQKFLTGGEHQIQVAYFEAKGTAMLKVWWRLDALAPTPTPLPTPKPDGGAPAATPAPAPGGSGEWFAQYYSNPALRGDPAATAAEAAIDYDWGFKSPRDGLPADNFSVRWTTDASFEAGTYTFSVTVDDGVRLWVDGNLLIDEWRRQAATTFTARTRLSAGTHRIQVAYFEATGAAVIKVWWRQDRANGTTPVAAKLVIDNLDENFTWGGPLRYRFTAPGGQGNSFFWTNNTTTYPVNYGKWTPVFEAGGRYEVFAFIPATRATTRKLRYRILHNGQRHDVFINQGWYSDEWVSLGTYTFRGDNTGKEFILAYDNTREPYGSAAIAFDAVKLVPAPLADP